ncbi:uncharacterized protein LOC115767797 [Drosophila novamexicana]|uniref:uncharacterized protein LOC115767797 n=1 Tax=Drosophila novamexicana TaxID=47314 RepID=UPI0011E5E8DD|nr:uncharacterized protein LOC115767797 [Drosophila novamexicana]
MKRSKDEDKDDVGVGNAALGNNSNNNNNNNSKINNNASPNISSGSNSNDANSGSGNTPGAVRTTGRVKKPKQVYDPSDNYISRGSRNSLPAPAPAPLTAQPPSPAQNTSAIQQQQRQLSPQPQAQTLATQSTNPPSQQAALVSASEVAHQTVAKEETSETVSVPSAEQQRNFDTCMKCGKSEAKRGSGYKSNFLTCKSCSLKWHFTCLPITFEILTNARKKYKCEKCRRCRNCMTTKCADTVQELLMCCVCANVYHLDCHWPRVMRDKLDDVKWKCYSCDPRYNSLDTDDDVAKIEPQSPPRKSKAGRKKRATSDPAVVVAKKIAANQVLTKNGLTDRCSSPSKIQTVVNASPSAATTLSMQENEPSKETKEATQPQSPPIASVPVPALPTSIEDKENGESTNTPQTAVPESGDPSSTVQTWNVDEVVSYVEKYYPREADVFKTQEIDGAALMVLTRQDIIDRFGLKLGPALRIYELVLALQNSVDDVTLAWCD